MSKRDVWSWPEGRGWQDDGVSVTRHKNGALTIEVAQEMAVDSYNQQFETAVELPPKIAAALLAWMRGNA